MKNIFTLFLTIVASCSAMATTLLPYQSKVLPATKLVKQTNLASNTIGVPVAGWYVAGNNPKKIIIATLPKDEAAAIGLTKDIARLLDLQELNFYKNAICQSVLSSLKQLKSLKILELHTDQALKVSMTI
ncbi:hypothetical protein [Flavobacterium crassostreae]|uniref:Uncharacterized protein n=1 Tax=Flavobacterium crassostreae TaxID=1763534 RepID=A0A1B9DXW0_9FLAO|nr:hypothetical protein [Flavobacterium crassostreae]OCB74518.1 hypothetical protein LPBF_11070 [Flavobacterium crassostreae]